MIAAQSDTSVRCHLLTRISEARQKTDQLFELLKPTAFYERPIPERHRLIFYVGHLEAFDWNLLHDSVLGLKSFHADYDRLFAFGIDPVGGKLPTDQPSDWPSVEIVHDYVTRIRRAIDDKLAKELASTNELVTDGFALSTLLSVAIEHRLMHAETLAYMLHQLPVKLKRGHAESEDLAGEVPSHRMVEIPAGSARLGLERGSGSFGWDNEFEACALTVPPFEIAQYKVTNRQYLDFIADGGYETRAYWTDDDWSWKSAEGISHPVFWNYANGKLLYRAMFAEIPLPLNWPVYVSHAEASAYARWAGMALPTEEQWHRAAYCAPDGRQRAYPWGNRAPDRSLGNFDFHRWDPLPVNAFPHAGSAFGVSGMLGNGWEWTSTVFAPFPGFQAFPFYPGYSADFFDGRHFVMKGGSARTAACMLRSSFRNWFQTHYQYAYAGFRCVNA